ncbi:hypothetical protein [Coleofasciculus sp. F4-SAH-05]|uniref:hypothetical protein n=1 Tax=Coleofasciculus sp. F4-SAH-05 TaxID=3069525 RepID=UPI0032F17E22
MTQPTLNQPQIPQRLHTDPPALWKTVILSSVAIHLVGLGLLRLALLGRFQDWRLSQRLIPVEMIAIASNATMPTPATQSPPSSVSQKTPAQSPESQPESAPQTNRPTQAIANTTQETRQPSPTTVSSPNSPNPTPTPSPTSTTFEGMGETPSPQSSEKPPNPTPPSSPSPTPSPEESTKPTSPENQSGGGFIASINELRIVSSGGGSIINPQRNPGDRLAEIQTESQPLSVDELTSLEITLEQPVVLKVIVFINDRGKAEVIPDKTQVQQGTLSQEQATKLANQIIADWEFSPTYMAYSPVYGSYSLTLEIDPLGN